METNIEIDDSIPPLVVLVQGSSKSGKSTLIRSFVKHFTKHNISEIKGSITIRSGKSQRITFLECSNDLSTMIDLGKIADIALIIIDGKIGFEMETFEFLSILQTHGFPNVIGVVTHLDSFKNSKQLQKLKKKMKKRFLKEVAEGCKLFYISKIQFGLYGKRDILNLARYLAVIKVKPLIWKSGHSYIYSDRFDILANITKEESTLVSFYGYIRGTDFEENKKIHINGLGDYSISSSHLIDDPVPIETKTIKKKKRTLKGKEKQIYAPHTNFDFATFDPNTSIINIPDKYVYYSKKLNEELVNIDEGEGQKMVLAMHSLNEAIDEQLDKNKNELNLLNDIKVSAQNTTLETNFIQIENVKEKNTNGLSNSEFKVLNEEEFEIPLSVKLEKDIYNNCEIPNISILDCTRFSPTEMLTIDKYLASSRKNCITGAEYEVESEEDKVSEEEDEDQDSLVEEPGSKNEINESKGNQKRKLIEEEDSDNNEGIEKRMIDIPKKEKEGKPDEVPQIDLSKYRDGLHRKGKYIRIDLFIETKLTKGLGSEFPIILTAFDGQDSMLSCQKVKILKHRWFPKILKSRDPLIISIGWRRFQTQMVYCRTDNNRRLRMIKYTPKYEHCEGIFFGCIVPLNTPFLAFQSMNENSPDFRISATGYTTEINNDFQLMKKLKLVGEPSEIYKNTAFIKGMFNSQEEVKKFLGAKIQTVSGIRGQIKKITKKGAEGSFRATFEDKILNSDIVVCKTWWKVKFPKFYNPILNYGKMRLMKNTYEIRKERNILPPVNPDSEYPKQIEREERVFAPLVIPKKLREKMPFDSREKVKKIAEHTIEKDRTKNLLKSLDLPSTKPLKIMLNTNEKNIYSLLQRMNTLKRKRDKEQKIKSELKSKERSHTEKRIDEIKKKALKEKKKLLYKKKGNHGKK